MTYQETLDYMYSQLPMYQRQGAVAFKKDLGNIVALLSLMGDPHKLLQCVHIAGTNGKGTTAHLIAAGLQANGLRVGMYTSPHYIDFRERIKINGVLIPEETVVTFVQQYRGAFEEIKPSFFEMTVALAFCYFAEQEVDMAVIEVGLGGRLDSTNVIIPMLSVITNISYDHQAMLGDTLPEIAAEKAGIIKTDVPVIIGEYQPEVEAVFANKAHEQGSAMSYAEHNTDLIVRDTGVDCLVNDMTWIEDISIDTSSAVQTKNIRTALYALHHLQPLLRLQPQLIRRGLEEAAQLTYYIGRYQVLGHSPTIIADSAHNIAGVNELMAYVEKQSFDQLHVVLGMVSDKDISKVLALLPTTATYYFVKADIPRGLPSKQLQTQAMEYNLLGGVYYSVASGYKQATGCSSASDLILVMGSIFVVAEVLAIR